MTVPQRTLNNGLAIPALGLGTWKSTKNDITDAVFSAISMGYRHIDCAPVYNNERAVGAALQRVFREKLLQRQELWITSKLWNNAHLPKHVQPAAERSIKDLGVDYLDLFLIHWPVSFRQDIAFPKKPDQYLPPDDTRLLDTWQAMERLVKKGLVRSIGVSNFKKSRLELFEKNAAIPPAINQVECHPCLQQQELLKYCKKKGVVLTAYAPLGSADRPAKIRREQEHSEILDMPIISKLAKKADISRGQLLLAWALDRKGVCVIPKTTRENHLRENLAATKISLSKEIIRQIDALDCGLRLIDAAFLCGEKSPYSLDWLWKDQHEKKAAA